MKTTNINLDESHPIWIKIEDYRKFPSRYRLKGKYKKLKKDIDKLVVDHHKKLRELYDSNHELYKDALDKSNSFLNTKINTLIDLDNRTKTPFIGWFRGMTFEGDTLPILEKIRPQYNSLNVKFVQSMTINIDKELSNIENSKCSPRQKTMVFHKFFIEPTPEIQFFLKNKLNRAKIIAWLLDGDSGSIRTTLVDLENQTTNGPTEKTINKLKELGLNFYK